MNAERKLSRREAIGVTLISLTGLGAFGGLMKSMLESARDREVRRLKFEEDLKDYRYEVRVPRSVLIPGVASALPPVVEGPSVRTVVDIFLAQNQPVTEKDASGVNRLVLTGVMRFDPVGRIAIERFPKYEIVNPVNIGIMDRLAQQ